MEGDGLVAVDEFRVLDGDRGVSIEETLRRRRKLTELIARKWLGRLVDTFIHLGPDGESICEVSAPRLICVTLS